MIHRRTVDAWTPDFVRDVVLLAEGKDEADLAQHLLAQSAFNDMVQVVDCRGRDRITPMIGLVVRSDRFLASGRGLGVFLDADDDASGAFDRVAQALATEGLPSPVEPGMVADDSRRRTGVFVSPGRGEMGAIEVLYLAAADPARVSAAADYLTAIAASGHPPPRKIKKATLQALLAALPRSPRQPGDGLQHDLIHDPSAFSAVGRFVKDLAEPL